MNNNDLYIIEADKMQGYVVVKDNNFIKRSLYNLGVMEQRVLACAFSMCDSRMVLGENELPKCEMSLNAFCELCNIERRGAVKYLKTVLEKLKKETYWIQKDDGALRLFSWIHTAEINPETDNIVVWLSLDVKPFLFNLNADFTEYKLPMILRFKNKYSNLVFDLINVDMGRKSFNYKGTNCYRGGSYQISVDEMKMRVQVKKGEENEMIYPNIRFVDLKRKVIEPAVKDINEFTDIIVDIEYVMKKNKTESIIFNYRRKTEEEFKDVPLFRGKPIERMR